MAERRPDRVLGGEHDVFWAWCAKGELRLQRCGGCGRLSWPVVAACPYCPADALVWERMSGHATLESWCTFHHDYYRGVLATPYTTILVTLAEGPLFMGDPLGFEKGAMTLGMDLTLEFIDAEDSAGAFRLPVFGPA